MLYDYGINPVTHVHETRVHALLSTGSAFNYSNGDAGWWKSGGSYTATSVRQFLSGDFNGDGLADAAAVYDYGLNPTAGGNETRVHVFLSTGSKFVLSNGSDGWWDATRYTASRVTQAVAGDFNGDGMSDIALMYDYGSSPSTGSSETRIHVLISTGSAFVLSNGSNGWWSSTGYTATAVIHAVVGDFNGDHRDDVAAIYTYPNHETRAHMFLSTGSSFAYQGSLGWWDAKSYTATNVIHAAAGDFNHDGRSDIALMYDYGRNPTTDRSETRIHVLLSTGTAFAPPSSGGWWSATGYTATRVVHLVPGDFNGDGRADLAALYDYGNRETRVHVFLSTGTAFSYQGDAGWWSATGYTASNVVHTAPGDDRPRDIDGDSLSDARETVLGTNPYVADTDGDGLADGAEVNTTGTDPLVADSDGDHCGDGGELGGDHLNGGQRDPLDAWDFFDVTGDGSIDLDDTIVVLLSFGKAPGSAGYDPLLDRYVPDAGQPWRTAAAIDGNGIDLEDAIASLESFGDDCG